MQSNSFLSEFPFFITISMYNSSISVRKMKSVSSLTSISGHQNTTKATFPIVVGHISHLPTSPSDWKFLCLISNFLENYSIPLIFILFVFLFVFNKKVINPGNKFSRYIARYLRVGNKCLLLLNIQILFIPALTGLA